MVEQTHIRREPVYRRTDTYWDGIRLVIVRILSESFIWLRILRPSGGGFTTPVI